MTMDFDDLRELLTMLRSSGVVEYEADGVRLRLIPAMPAAPESPSLSDAEKREMRSKLLFAHEMPDFQSRRTT